MAGALYDPSDGDIDPAQLTQALAKGARDMGQQILRFTPATGVTQKDDDSWIVHTEKGDIRCEIVVNAAGYYAQRVGEWFKPYGGRTVPMMVMSHQYMIFDEVPAVRGWSAESGRKLPLLRDVDTSYYLRQEKTGFNLGPYERNCRAHWATPDDPLPEDFSFQLYPDDLERLEFQIEDSMAGICDGVKEGTLTMQQGGGVGYDFSTLRPNGSYARRVGSMASGPVSFMRVWDSMCATLVSSAYRRGAMMATLRCDHPDIESFIDAKRNPRELRNFNLSVLVSDDFMQALRDDLPWALVFPERALGDSQQTRGREIIQRCWSGEREAVPCVVVKKIAARELWERIMRANYDMAEPGVLFIDRINQQNNLYYRENISATNPCGEIPLPPYGACNLGSINLTRLVQSAFSADARLDFDMLEYTVRIALRMLNHIIDLSRFPLQIALVSNLIKGFFLDCRGQSFEFKREFKSRFIPSQ